MASNQAGNDSNLVLSSKCQDFHICYKNGHDWWGENFANLKSKLLCRSGVFVSEHFESSLSFLKMLNIVFTFFKTLDVVCSIIIKSN